MKGRDWEASSARSVTPRVVEAGIASVLLALSLALGALDSVAYAQRGIDGAATAATAPQKWAVIIGVGDYHDPSLGDLPNAVNDARAVREALTSIADGFAASNVLLLADGEGNERVPTRANIMKYVASYLALAQPDDTFLLYFAGHGVTESEQLYLMPSDATSVNVGFTGFPFSEIERLLKESNPKKKILILDACHSGTGRTRAEFSDDAVAELDRAAEGIVVLASCSGQELSHEMGDTGHGAFTYFLLEALGGKADGNGDTRLSASEVIAYTWDKTRRWAAQKGFVQTPWHKEVGFGEITIATVGKTTTASTEVEYGFAGSEPIADTQAENTDSQSLLLPSNGKSTFAPRVTVLSTAKRHPTLTDPKVSPAIVEAGEECDVSVQVEKDRYNIVHGVQVHFLEDHDTLTMLDEDSSGLWRQRLHVPASALPGECTIVFAAKDARGNDVIIRTSDGKSTKLIVQTTLLIK